MESRPSKLEYSQSAPTTSIGGISSGVSDIESIVSLGDNTLHRGDIADDHEFPPVNPDFAFPDGNIEVRTTDQTFWIHEYHINNFSMLAAIIQKAKGSNATLNAGRRTLLVCGPEVRGVDIYNTLKVIYASHIHGIPDFDSDIMTSALRIAHTFDYPGLQKFALSKLEGMDLSAIKRIQLSDEFSLPSLEMPAFVELCNRAEPITLFEADILGMSRFVEIARMRETQRLHQATKLMKEALPKPLETMKLRNSTSTEYVRDDPDYCSGRSQLPRCDCRCSPTGFNHDLKRCNIHEIAPQVLEEGRRLLKERNELLEQLNAIQSSVTCGLEQVAFPSNSEVIDVQTELSNASWVRKKHIAKCAAEPADEPMSQPTARNAEEVVPEVIEVPIAESLSQKSVEIPAGESSESTPRLDPPSVAATYPVNHTYGLVGMHDCTIFNDDEILYEDTYMGGLGAPLFEDLF